MAVEYLGSGNDDGTNFGNSTSDKIGFYGLTTPIVQPSISLSAGDTITALAADVAAIKEALVALNLVA